MTLLAMGVELLDVSHCSLPRKDWSLGTLACLIKNNTRPLGGQSKAGTFLPDAETAILHVFPIDFTETPEMLERLKKDRCRIREAVARSKIGKTALVVSPVDGTALRVAPVVNCVSAMPGRRT